ncbi:MAG: outer membrane protein assembly factor BamB [Bacillariaceae sp.]|jgi:outer membrane protein assembly factor BamB
MKISEEIVDSAHFRKKRGRLLLPTLLLVCLACCAISSQIGASVVATSVSSEDNIYNLDDFDDDDDDDDDDDPVIFSEKNNKDTAFDQEDEDRDGERGSERVLTPPEIIVVVAVDGTVAGISKETGQILWKQSEKTAASSSSSSSYIKPSTSSKTLLEEASYILRPLVSTTTTTKSASLASYTAVPSVDGTVYTTTNDVTTSTSVKELVARAPFLDDGRFFVGSRQSSAAALDGETGQILRVVKNTQDEDERSASSLPTLDDRNVVWIGRVDNLITVQDARTGMVDAKFSVAEIMSVADMHGMMGKEAWKSKQVIRPNSSSRRDSDDDSGGEDDDFSKSEQNHMIYPRLGLPASDTTSSLSSTATATFEYTSALIATPNGNVALRDFDDDNKLTWVADESFDSPIVFAIDAVTGSVMGVDIIPDVPDSDASLDDITKEMERQSDIVSLDDTPIVGAMSNGQLYALPLRRNMDAVTGKATSSATVIASTSSAAASSSNGAKHITQLVSQLPGRPNANFQHSDNSNNQHQQQFINQQQNHDHNPTGRHGTLAAKKSCVSSSPTFPSCLIKNPSDHKISSEAVPPLGNGANLISGKHQRQFQQHEQSDASLAVMTSQFHKEDDGGFHHPQYGYVSPQDLGGFYHPEYGYVSPRDLYGTKNRTHKNSYQKFFRVLGSWLPPTIALLFVVSFELGRRKRLNDERERQDSILKVERDDKINGVLSTADKLDGEQQTSDQSRQQEVISVSEDVLGYGGHGTVVYKGVLEGRNVAVKRMLKAYHASADREISLLIESDGDPNVVRYFLKEVRGDFVYLALELCDLSLHELIAILRVNQHQTKSVLSDAEEGTCDFSSESMDAIVRILLQIASGVKHLHSLRIVHRDLKPAVSVTFFLRIQTLVLFVIFHQV